MMVLRRTVNHALSIPTMEETLQKYIDKSNPKTSSSSSTIVPPILGLNMNAETKLFEANGERTQNLEFLYQALMTGKPTSVESERCFSNAGVFATKVRSRLGDRSLCDFDVDLIIFCEIRKINSYVSHTYHVFY